MPTDESLIGHSQLLHTVDGVITYLGFALLAGCVLAWLAVGRRDPLKGSLRVVPALQENALIAPILLYLVGYLLIRAACIALGITFTNPTINVISGSAAQVGGTLGCLIVARRAFPGGIQEFVFSGPSKVRWVRSVVLAGSTLFIALAVCPVILEWTVRGISYYRSDTEFSPHRTIQALHDSSTTGAMRVLLWSGAALIAPLAEECFFRGIVQTWLVGVLHGRRIAVLAGAVLFGLAHSSHPYTIPALIVLGLLLGYAYEKTGGLLAPFLIHIGFNVKTLAWDALGNG